MALPAYDQCIKASHMFNLLDARGVISVTERQSYILRVRELAKACGEAWLATEGGGTTRMSEQVQCPRSAAGVRFRLSRSRQELLVVCLRTLQIQPFCDGSHKGTGFTPVEYKPAAAEEAWFCACKRSGQKTDVRRKP